MSGIQDLEGADAVSSLLDPGDFVSGRGARRIGEQARSTQESQREELQRQFDLGQSRLEPTFAEAVPAFQQQSALAGAQGPEAQRAALQGFQEDPGTEFARQQGLRLVESGAAAGGGLGGGDRLRNLSRLGTDLASRGLSNQFNRLGVVSGAGQGAGTAQVGLGSRFASDLSGVNQAGAQNQINAIGAEQQQRNSAVQTGLGLFSALSDVEMKTDVKALSPEKCFNLVMSTPMYAWKYLEECGIDKEQHFGPMYQESPDCIKTEGEKSLQVHDELWLIAGAMKHMLEMKNG